MVLLCVHSCGTALMWPRTAIRSLMKVLSLQKITCRPVSSRLSSNAATRLFEYLRWGSTGDPATAVCAARQAFMLVLSSTLSFPELSIGLCLPVNGIVEQSQRSNMCATVGCWIDMVLCKVGRISIQPSHCDSCVRGGRPRRFATYSCACPPRLAASQRSVPVVHKMTQ